MAITRAQQAKQMLQDGGTTFGVLSDKPDISREIEQKVIDHENEYMERTGKVPPEFYGEKFRIKLMEEYMDRQPKANGGGMLVQPGFGGTRQGYRGDDAYGSGDQVAGGDNLWKGYGFNYSRVQLSQALKNMDDVKAWFRFMGQPFDDVSVTTGVKKTF